MSTGGGGGGVGDWQEVKPTVKRAAAKARAANFMDVIGLSFVLCSMMRNHPERRFRRAKLTVCGTIANPQLWKPYTVQIFRQIMKFKICEFHPALSGRLRPRPMTPDCPAVSCPASLH